MARWLNRTVLSGASVAQNGTSSHTCSFTPASGGNYLLAIVTGSVTCSTPAGWTLVAASVEMAGLYAFAKIASADEDSFATTHNGSNYAIRGIVYEFPAGTSVIGANYAFGLGGGTISSPALSGLEGTYSVFAARSHSLALANGSMSVNPWTLPATKDYEAYVGYAGGTEGVGLSVAYQDDTTGSTFAPNYNMTWENEPNNRGEGIIFALSIPEGPTEPEAPMVNTLRIGSITPSKLYAGSTEATRAYLGTTLVYGSLVEGDGPRLYMTPDSDSYTVGNTIYVTIRADSQAIATNVVQANFTYPTAYLTYDHIDTSMSPYTMTIQEGVFAGEVKIGVGILDGEVSGDQIVAVVAFTATAAGSATLSFTNESAIVERATAEDICQGKTGATYTIA